MPRSLVPNQFDYAGIYVEGERSVFRFHKPHSASFMSGMLVPFGDPIPFFPGTKADLKLRSVIRSATMVIPPIDGIYIDFFAAWIPHRIVWNSMPQFLGENDATAWTQAVEKVYPSVAFQSLSNNLSSYYRSEDFNGDKSTFLGNFFLSVHYGVFNKNLINSNFAIYDKQINVLAYRGYYSFWNHFIRDENYQRPVLFSKTDTGSAGEFGYLVRDYKISDDIDEEGEIIEVLLSSADYGINLEVGASAPAGKALLMPVNKFHDWATSLLPQPQFGDAVSFSLATEAPLKTKSGLYSLGTTAWQVGSSTTLDIDNYYLSFNPNAAGNVSAESGANGGAANVNKMNLYADLTSATAMTINQFRTSVMYQRYLEALARGGRRVPEYYDVIYGVKNSAAMMDYPQLLSHSRYILGVNQVVATADSSGEAWTSHLGDTGAYSLTDLRDIPCCEKEFTEFGYLHIFYCIRANNRYSQAVPPHFFRHTLMDEYNPFFDHIGDVAVPNYYINSSASHTSGDTDNFGYQEAWFDIRSQIGLSVGALNKDYGSLAYWSVGEVLPKTLKTCTPGYLCFSPENFNDLFVAPYWNYPQFIIDGLIYGRVAGRMSAHSIPGIVGRI